MERNVELLQETMQFINDHPEKHRQSSYFDCGTPLCFAGWAIVLAGYTEEQAVTWPAHWASELCAIGWFAANLLGLTGAEAWTLFNAGNTRQMLDLMVKDLANGDELKVDHEYRMET